MKNNLEIEYKTLIKVSQYSRIHSEIGFQEPVLQVNTYYDNINGDITNQRCMARIRSLNDTYEFTLKIPQSKGVLEVSTLCDSPEITHPEIINILQQYGFYNVTKVLATSRTFRSTTQDNYAQICLDHTIFDDGYQDYEIEYELFEDNPLAYDSFLNFLTQYNIEYKKAPAKVARALNHMK